MFTWQGTWCTTHLSHVVQRDSSEVTINRAQITHLLLVHSFLKIVNDELMKVRGKPQYAEKTPRQVNFRKCHMHAQGLRPKPQTALNPTQALQWWQVGKWANLPLPRLWQSGQTYPYLGCGKVDKLTLTLAVAKWINLPLPRLWQSGQTYPYPGCGKVDKLTTTQAVAKWTNLPLPWLWQSGQTYHYPGCGKVDKLILTQDVAKWTNLPLPRLWKSGQIYPYPGCVPDCMKGDKLTLTQAVIRDFSPSPTVCKI